MSVILKQFFLLQVTIASFTLHCIALQIVAKKYGGEAPTKTP